MARAEDHGESRWTSRVDAVIDEEARALLSVDARRGFEQRVMASLSASRPRVEFWRLRRLAMAAAALTLVLASGLAVLWWAAKPGPGQPPRDWAAARPSVVDPAGSGRGATRAGDEGDAGGEGAGRGGADTSGAWPDEGRDRRQAPGDERGEAPAGGEEAVEADSREGVSLGVSIASLQAPEPLRVPSLRVDALQIDAVQVPSLTMERREPEKKPDPASGPDKE